MIKKPIILTASILKIYVTWHGTNVKLLEDDMETSKHVGIYITYITQKYTVVTLIMLLVVIKTVEQFKPTATFCYKKCIWLYKMLHVSAPNGRHLEGINKDKGRG